VEPMPHGGERDPAQHATPDELLEHLAAYGRVAVCDLPERLRGPALLALAWSRRLIRLEALANASVGFSDGSKIERYEWVGFRRCAFGSTATEALAEDRRRSGKERRLHVVLSEAGERAWAEHAHREQPVQG